MTISDFDPRNLTLYKEPRYLVHFQYQDNSKVYRYALVEVIDQSKINHRTKQKDDEQNLSQKEIWNKYKLKV